jgi:Tetratricopeptide repeat
MTTTMRMLLIALLLSTSGLAIAGSASKDEHFKKGNALFDQGEFQGASKEFELAYAKTHDPDVLFNLAQSYRYSNEFEKAMKTYQSFLKEQPNSPERDAVKAAIGNLDKLVKHQTQVKLDRPTGRFPKIHYVAPATKGEPENPIVSALGNRHIIVMATEQIGPNRIAGWTNSVWGPGGGSTTTTAVREVSETGVVETAAIDALSNGGFQVIDLGVVRGRIAPRPHVENLNGPAEDDATRVVALRSMADLVLVVRGTARTAAVAAMAGSGMTSGQADVSARVIRVSDGTVLASKSQHAAQVHVDPTTAQSNALREATRMALSSLTQELNDKYP